jgi:hypothetical protein
MKVETPSRLSELFEVDRATMLRALRDVPADSETTPGRPLYKVSTGMNALVKHRAATGRTSGRRQQQDVDSGGVDAAWQDSGLVRLYAELDEADGSMRKLPTLAARRKAAVAMIPLIARVDQAIRQRGRANGQDADTIDMRSDLLYQLQLRGLEQPCGWTQSETWNAMNSEQRG